MKILFDIGNTSIAITFYDGEKFQKISHKTHPFLEKSDYFLLLKNDLKNFNIEEKDITDVIYSSVVPEIDNSLKEAITDLFGNNLLNINCDLDLGIKLDVDNPKEVGADLIAALVGAKKKYGYPCLIADLGTASKILFINKEGSFSSCLIMPGLSLSANALFQNASLLSEMPLKSPNTILASNTEDAINSGVLIGHAEMINGLCNRYEEEIGYKCKRILTGGYAEKIRDLLEKSNYIYDSEIVFDGMLEIWKRNK